ncbi:hypothetical protein KJ885_04915 [Patescibacteria group bacterium]|nr:hypothetical protein [Patescibacteria group bacterium]
MKKKKKKVSRKLQGKHVISIVVVAFFIISVCGMSMWMKGRGKYNRATPATPHQGEGPATPAQPPKDQYVPPSIPTPPDENREEGAF